MVRALELLGNPSSVRKARVFTSDVLVAEGVEASVIEVAVLLVKRTRNQRDPWQRDDLTDGRHRRSFHQNRGGGGSCTSRPASCARGRSRRTPSAGGRRVRERLGNRTARDPQVGLVRDRSVARTTETNLPVGEGSRAWCSRGSILAACRQARRAHVLDLSR
jgi:hypothetical protein